MKIWTSVLVLTFCSSVLTADSLVCTANGDGTVVPCSLSPLQLTAQFPALSVSGNTISVTSMLEFAVAGRALPALTVSVSGTVDDTLLFPTAPAGDVYVTSIVYGFAQYTADPGSSAALSFQIGPGGSGSPVINLNPLAQPPPFCPPGGTGGCSFSGTLAASAYSTLAIQSTATLVANAGSDPNGDVMSGGIFSFARFKADGVTPDPFTATPEPGACGLALAGLALVGVWRRRR